MFPHYCYLYSYLHGVAWQTWISTAKDAWQSIGWPHHGTPPGYMHACPAWLNQDNLGSLE